MDAKISSVYMLHTRDSLQTSGHMQTENEGMEKKNYSMQMKESWSSNTYIRQNRL